VRPAITHNKVMIIDGATVITASFNFTAASQSRNVENLLLIADPALAALHDENGGKRRAASVPLGRCHLDRWQRNSLAAHPCLDPGVPYVSRNLR
jgi:phosphatidylserine/phosphatidylglycerophosphate/cardiolipin synthase-like enzyme